MSKDKDKNKKHKKLKIILLVGSIFLLITLVVLLIIIINLVKDNNRSDYVRRNIDFSEIIKKNYIDGFNSTSSTGKFSYILPEEDINELLAIGNDSLNDKHIESIYYSVDESGIRYFYVDLTKVVIKTRVVISTIPSITDSSTVSLSIHSVTIGKINALSYLQRNGYLTSNYLDTYFKACHLPITYDESSLSFKITPFNYIDEFPNSEIGEELFIKAKGVENALQLNNSLFGFDMDLSRIRSSNVSFNDVDTTDIPNIHDEILNGSEDSYPSMSTLESKTIYSLNEETLNKLVKSSFVSNKREEIVSSLTENKVSYDIKGINVHIDVIDKITFKIFLSVNSYLVDVDVELIYASSSPFSFKANFIVESSGSPVVNKALGNALSSLADEYNYLTYQTSNKLFSINFESINEEFSDPDIKYCSKLIEINPATHCIDFKIVKDF